MEAEVTIEKPFKCKSCNATFTNEDHLEVHRRRHEMSLNLGLGNSNNNSNQPEGFADQTPTPTRFFRISEEVGFFQDLQNVNPFDVEFAKASATGTPSSDTNFEFQFTPSTTSTTIANPNDTLNTPQVLGFPPCTPLPGPNQTNTTFIGKKRTILTPTGTAPNVPSFDEPNPNKTETTVPQAECESSSQDPNSKNKYKTLQLKLNCSPAPISPGQTSSPNILISPKKAELLERNRAAASRSRERRKQWVSALESKCASLQSVLSQVQSEVIKLRQENSMLKEELGKHGNCDVTRGTWDPKSQIIQPQLSMPRPPPFQPAILRSPSSSTRIQISSITSLQQIPGVQIIQIEPRDSKLPKATKRGRPRRGHERRVTNITLPQAPTLSESESTKLPIKVQILPLHKVKADNEQSK